MSACFSLMKKGESEPTHLHAVDEEMARAFGEEPDPVKWYKNWYNTIGLAIACGQDLDQMARECEQDMPSWTAIIRWLQANYEFNAWREV